MKLLDMLTELLPASVGGGAAMGTTGGLGLGGALHVFGDAMNAPRRAMIRGLGGIGDTIGLVPGGADSGEGAELVRHLFRQPEPTTYVRPFTGNRRTIGMNEHGGGFPDPTQTDEVTEEGDSPWVTGLGLAADIFLDPINLATMGAGGIGGAFGGVRKLNNLEDAAQEAFMANRLTRARAGTEILPGAKVQFPELAGAQLGNIGGTQTPMPMTTPFADIGRRLEMLPRLQASPEDIEAILAENRAAKLARFWNRGPQQYEPLPQLGELPITQRIREMAQQAAIDEALAGNPGFRSVTDESLMPRSNPLLAALMGRAENEARLPAQLYGDKMVLRNR